MATLLPDGAEGALEELGASHPVIVVDVLPLPY
jgi:hypothetical protein